jgi:large subunit ribosomal protein L35
MNSGIFGCFFWAIVDYTLSLLPLKKQEVMPKMKTNSSAKKRFSITGTGKIKRKHAFKRHILTKKEKDRKRALRHDGMVHKSDMSNVKLMLVIGK